MSLFNEYYSVIISNSALKSVILVIASIIAAKLVDIIFTFIFKRLVDKTKTSLDDKILQLLQVNIAMYKDPKMDPINQPRKVNANVI